MNCAPPRRQPRLARPGGRSGGFTMVELLTVMAIVVLLLALVVPAVRSLSSNKLNSSGRLFSNLLTVARSEAISRGTLMQVRIVTASWKSGGADDATMHYRKYGLWQHKPPAAAGAAADPDPYLQVSPWETLPDGIIFEANPSPDSDSNYPFSAAATNPGTYFLNSSYAGAFSRTGVATGGATADTVSVEFTPTGGLNLGNVGAISALYFVLVPGVLSGGGINYTAAKHPNWVAVEITPLTGRIQIVRP